MIQTLFQLFKLFNVFVRPSATSCRIGLTESRLRRRCRGGPHLRDGWLGRSASELTKRTCLPDDGEGYFYDSTKDESTFSSFFRWLQCYYKSGMHNLVDHNGRTIWFSGPAGPLAPKGKNHSSLCAYLSATFSSFLGDLP